MAPDDGAADIAYQKLVLRPNVTVLFCETSLVNVSPAPATLDGSVALVGVTAPPKNVAIISLFAVGETLAVAADRPFVPLDPLVSENCVMAIH
jgi:hypothetical protein